MDDAEKYIIIHYLWQGKKTVNIFVLNCPATQFARLTQFVQPKQPCVKKNAGARLMRACCFRYSCKMCSREPGLRNTSFWRFIRRWTTMRRDFTTLESYHADNHFIHFIHHNILQVNGRSISFMWQSNLPGMCICTYFIGQRSVLPDAVLLQHYVCCNRALSGHSVKNRSIIAISHAVLLTNLLQCKNPEHIVHQGVLRNYESHLKVA